MCPTSKFFNFRQGVITKQLAAAALVCAVAPGSVFATAAYDAGAFVQFTSITPDPGLIVELLIDDSSVTQFVDGVASVDEASSTPEIEATDFDSQIVRVTGEASSPATGASTSDASASNFSSITAINPTDANLELVVDFFYGWDASVLIDDPLLETAGASVAILMETVLGENILDVAFDLVAAGEGMDGSSGSFTLLLTGGSVDGIFTDLMVEGIAIASADDTPPPGVPVPATVALLCIGLLGLASRRRSSAVTA